MTVIDIENLLDTCKDEYFLVEESTGNIYYQYKGEKKVFINSNKDSFNKCLFAYNNFVKNNNFTLVTAENIINICKVIILDFRELSAPALFYSILRKHQLM